MSEKLKPCPFCGSSAAIRKKAKKWAVSCMSEIGCQGQVDIENDGLNGWMSSAVAAEAWNERAPLPNGRIDAEPGMSEEALMAITRLLKAELDRRAALRMAK